MAEEKINKQEKKSSKKPYISAVGRRREAVAKVRLYDPGNAKIQVNGIEFKKGDIVVNGKPVGDYFRFVGLKPEYNRIFRDTNADEKYAFSVKVAGGGLSGQLDAMVHGVARVLSKKDKEKYHALLREKGYLTRDARARERRKVGMGGKARRKKQSPKR